MPKQSLTSQMIDGVVESSPKKSKLSSNDTPLKICPQCYHYMKLAVKSCYECSFEFYDVRKPRAVKKCES